MNAFKMFGSTENDGFGGPGDVLKGLPDMGRAGPPNPGILGPGTVIGPGPAVGPGPTVGPGPA